MGQYRQKTYAVSLEASGGADTDRVWDVPTSEPLRQISVIISSKGETLAAGNLDWDVLYGGKWAGTPYAAGSSHSGGVSQGSGAIAGGAEVLATVYNSTGFIPVNSPAMPVSVDNQGFPVVVELTNNKAVPITVYVTFLSETINTNV